MGEKSVMTDTVEIVDVAPRDGLQSQPRVLDTAVKVELIRRLAQAGLRRIEVASFVNPQRVPQMADAEALIAQLPAIAGVRYIGLVLNRRGFERAQAAGIAEINCAVSASDSFSRRNQGMDTQAMMAVIADVTREAQKAQLPCSVTLSNAFGCPFEGEVPVAAVAGLVRQLIDMGVKEIALADTIGAAGPSDVVQRLGAVMKISDEVKWRCHFHDTRNMAVANTWAAWQTGVRSFDASCGGIGGCPFAPAATGNVATEDLLYLFQRMQVDTGVDIKQIIATARWLEEPLGIAMPGMLTRAGLFPPD